MRRVFITVLDGFAWRGSRIDLGAIKMVPSIVWYLRGHRGAPAEPIGSARAEGLQGLIARPLLFAGVLIACAGLIVELDYARSPTPLNETLLGLFSLSFEANVPTWYASILLFSCGLVLAAIGIECTNRWRRWWLGLAAGFFAMSIDEAVELHEQLGGHFGGGGILFFDWVIPAGIVVAAIGAIYVPFLRALPPRRRNWFLVAGAIYVGGAVVAELPLGWWTERAGSDNLTYALIDWVEESMELVGASLFLLALAARWGERAEAEP